METVNFINEYLFGPGIALCLAYIAYQNHSINKNKLKLDHYEKRYEVYEITLKFIQELSDNGAGQQLHRSFIAKKESAKFLFSDDESIYQLLNEIHKKSVPINTYKSGKKDKGGDSSVVQESSEQSNKNLSWMVDVAIKDLSNKMKPYLSLSA